MAVVLMASVANNESNVVLGGELQSLGYVSRLRDVDSITNKVAQGARLRNGVIRIAGAIGEEWGHKRGGGFIAKTNMFLLTVVFLHLVKNFN